MSCLLFERGLIGKTSAMTKLYEIDAGRSMVTLMMMRASVTSNFE